MAEHASPIARADLTGLVLAGGEGSRMGGADKGLQPWRGRPLVDHVLERFAPQVGPLAISANRHLDDYARRGLPVLRDDDEVRLGPLAGLLQGLRHARTPWLAVVPCDAPRLPADMVERLLAHAVAAGARGAFAAWSGPPDEGPADAPPVLHREPLFCVIRLLGDDLPAALVRALAEGERRVGRWLQVQGVVPCPFDRAQDAGAFANFNRLEDLQA